MRNTNSSRHEANGTKQPNNITLNVFDMSPTERIHLSALQNRDQKIVLDVRAAYYNPKEGKFKITRGGIEMTREKAPGFCQEILDVLDRPELSRLPIPARVRDWELPEDRPKPKKLRQFWAEQRDQTQLRITESLDTMTGDKKVDIAFYTPGDDGKMLRRKGADVTMGDVPVLHAALSEIMRSNELEIIKDLRASGKYKYFNFLSSLGRPDPELGEPEKLEPTPHILPEESEAGHVSAYKTLHEAGFNVGRQGNRIKANKRVKRKANPTKGQYSRK